MRSTWREEGEGGKEEEEEEEEREDPPSATCRHEIVNVQRSGGDGVNTGGTARMRRYDSDSCPVQWSLHFSRFEGVKQDPIDADDELTTSMA